MKFAIAKLVLWSRDESKSPRVVTFSESGLNLISGGSRSGKSAIIKIIDYCLGSSECHIPKLGPIRRSAGWYGIVVATEEGYKLLARRDPGEQDSTDEYMILETTVPAIPRTPEGNANRTAAGGILSRLARLPQATADFHETGSGYKGRASFGDMTAFLFQPQSLVANESVMFFETEDEAHARKLSEIFPLVLGAVDADTLVNQHRLSIVRRNLERLRRRFDALRDTVKDHAGEVRGRYLVAMELGLIQDDKGSLDSADSNVLLSRLSEVVSEWKRGVRPGSDIAPFGSEKRIASLREQETLLAVQVSALRLRLVQLRELAQAKRMSDASLARERARLGSGSWLVQALSIKEEKCALCGQPNHTAASELGALLQRTEQVEQQWRGVHSVAPMLDAEEVEVRKALTQEEESLRHLRAELSQARQLSDSVLRMDEERAVFLGRLEEFLEMARALAADGELEREIEDLESEEESLRALVDSSAIAQRKEDALFVLSKYAQHYGRIVELEKPDALIQLDTGKLSVRIIDEDGGDAWLNQIGSGANHLGYHVATLLALHELFVKRSIPYVPSFLVIDQPSQTQFPDDVDEDVEREELAAVHKAFEAIDSAIDRTDGALQVIVSEHAAKTLSAGIKHLHHVETWRRGRKLVPWHWDPEAQGKKGMNADWALADVAEDTLKPALASWLRRDLSRLERVSIHRATFEDVGIRFEVTVSESGRRTETSVTGLIRRDLKCVFD